MSQHIDPIVIVLEPQDADHTPPNEDQIQLQLDAIPPQAAGHDSPNQDQIEPPQLDAVPPQAAGHNPPNQDQIEPQLDATPPQAADHNPPNLNQIQPDPNAVQPQAADHNPQNLNQIVPDPNAIQPQAADHNPPNLNQIQPDPNAIPPQAADHNPPSPEIGAVNSISLDLIEGPNISHLYDVWRDIFLSDKSVTAVTALHSYGYLVSLLMTLWGMPSYLQFGQLSTILIKIAVQMIGLCVSSLGVNASYMRRPKLLSYFFVYQLIQTIFSFFGLYYLFRTSRGEIFKDYVTEPFYNIKLVDFPFGAEKSAVDMSAEPAYEISLLYFRAIYMLIVTNMFNIYSVYSVGRKLWNQQSSRVGIIQEPLAEVHIPPANQEGGDQQIPNEQADNNANQEGGDQQIPNEQADNNANQEGGDQQIPNEPANNNEGQVNLNMGQRESIPMSFSGKVGLLFGL